MLEQLVPGVRTVTADELGFGATQRARQGRGSSLPDAPVVTADDPQVAEIMRLALQFKGVILTGPPGTSKSYYAEIAANILAGAKERREFIQFHASYQYEDFMVGFAPTETHFRTKEGSFLRLVKNAALFPEHTYVLVIDELSRADVGRVFGEALTYIDRTKREEVFLIANGEEIKVPSNFIIIATMNPFDRGVDEVDAAFERRFAKITMDPKVEFLDSILTRARMEDGLKQRVLTWFRDINREAENTPAAAVGHAYFTSASDQDSLRDLWNYQLRYLVERAFRREPDRRRHFTDRWEQALVTPEPVEEAELAPLDQSQEPEAQS